MFNDDNKNKIAQLETDYIVGKKNIELLQKDVSIQQQKNQRNLFMMLALGTLTLLGFALYFNKRIQQKKKEVEAQNKLIHQQKDELQNLNHVKDRLFSVISHDLRNPLTTLQSYLMLSDNENLSADKRILFKNQSIQAVAQTGNLLDNLLAWAKMQLRDTTPTIKPFQIIEIVQDAIDLLKPQADQKEINFNINLAPKQVFTDIDIISIALRNILTNAIKFSPLNSTVYIEGGMYESYYHLSIRDKGPGMNQKQIESILQHSNFDSLSGTSGEVGSGLGLFLVKQVLKKIDVPLIIESEEGKGSTFILQFKVR